MLFVGVGLPPCLGSLAPGLCDTAGEGRRGHQERADQQSPGDSHDSSYPVSGRTRILVVSGASNRPTMPSCRGVARSSTLRCVCRQLTPESLVRAGAYRHEVSEGFVQGAERDVSIRVGPTDGTRSTLWASSTGRKSCDERKSDPMAGRPIEGPIPGLRGSDRASGRRPLFYRLDDLALVPGPRLGVCV